MKIIFKFVAVALAVCVVFSLPYMGWAQGYSPQASATAPASVLPPGDGKTLVANTCSQCHSLDLITQKHQTKEQWAATVNLMIERGAQATDTQADLIIGYLATNFGKLIYINSASAMELQQDLALTPDEAAALVSYRQQNGGFKNLNDVLKVPGVNAKKIHDQSANIIFVATP